MKELNVEYLAADLCKFGLDYYTHQRRESRHTKILVIFIIYAHLVSY